MSLRLCLPLLLLLASTASAQSLFPVKINHKWGLIDRNGHISLPPTYDAIGEFDRFGHAAMQQNGLFGLLDDKRAIIFQPTFEELAALDSTLFIVASKGHRRVINIQGETIFEDDFSLAVALPNGSLKIQQNGRWGIIGKDGRPLVPAEYDDLELRADGRYQTTLNGLFGLYANNGNKILPPHCKAFRTVENSGLTFYQKDNKWGAVDESGIEILPPTYTQFVPMDAYIKLLLEKDKQDLLHIGEKRLVNKVPYSDYRPTADGRIIVRSTDHALGLIDSQGEVLLPPAYQEIEELDENRFRVLQNELWGIVAMGGQRIAECQYDFIGPLAASTPVCIYKKRERFGLLNLEGTQLTPPIYTDIEINGLEARAFKNKLLEIIELNADGTSKNAEAIGVYASIKLQRKPLQPIIRSQRRLRGQADGNIIGQFEWFYEGKSKKWGLRRLRDAAVVIPPTFQHIQIERELGFTIVGVETTVNYDFDRTTYSFEHTYGILNNEFGKLTTPINLLDIRMSDFNKGLPLARIVTADGRHGLIKRSGKVLMEGFAFIGEFSANGLARASKTGRLSGSTKQLALMPLKSYLHSLKSPNYMADFTLHDRDFDKKAQLSCEDCLFGYIDTIGNVKIPFQFLLAKEFTNGLGIAQADNGQWGAIDQAGQHVLPFDFDKTAFLAKTQDSILILTKNEQRFGALGTKGNSALPTRYQAVGDYSEGLFPVKHNGLWGFADSLGHERVPCRFEEARPFHNGLAAAKMEGLWGFVNNEGAWVVAHQYRDLGDFSDGMAWAKTKKGIGYLNTKGEMAITPSFANASDFKCGVARVKIGQKFGLINKMGAWVAKPQFDDLSDFDENRLAVARSGKPGKLRYALVDTKGAQVGPDDFQKIMPFQEGRAAAIHKDKYGFIDTKGEWAVPPDYDKVSAFCEGRAWVQKDGACGYIDSLGRSITPLAYSKCADFRDGRAVVQHNIRQGGLLDLAGNSIIDTHLPKLMDYGDGLCLLRDEQGRFYFLTENETPLEGRFEAARTFSNGIAAVQLTGKWGFINQAGMAIVPPKYDEIKPCQNGFATVRISRVHGLADLAGHLIAPVDYEFLDYAGNGLFRVEQGGATGYLDTSGKWIWPLQE